MSGDTVEQCCVGATRLEYSPHSSIYGTTGLLYSKCFQLDAVIADPECLQHSVDQVLIILVTSYMVYLLKVKVVSIIRKRLVTLMMKVLLMEVILMPSSVVSILQLLLVFPLTITLLILT